MHPYRSKQFQNHAASYLIAVLRMKVVIVSRDCSSATIVFDFLNGRNYSNNKKLLLGLRNCSCILGR